MSGFSYMSLKSNQIPPDCAHLLPNGKILLIYQSGATYIYEPDKYGSYVNGSERRIQNCPYTYLYGPTTVNKNGTVSFHPGEYGTGLTAGHYTSTFDPDRETWSSVQGGLDDHQLSFISDDGRIMNSAYQYAPDVTFASANKQRWLYSYNPTNARQMTSEAGGALMPNGDNFIFFSDPFDTYGLAGTWGFICPGYTSEQQGAGSSNIPANLYTGYQPTAGLNSVNIGYWRLPNDTTRARWKSVGWISYEIGANFYMPKIDKYVLLSGVGAIYTVPKTFGNLQLARPAEMGMEPQWPDPASQSYYLGTVKATNNNQSPAAAISSGTFTFRSNDIPPLGWNNSFGNMANQNLYFMDFDVTGTPAFAKKVHIRLANNTKWVAIKYTAATTDGVDITLTGCTFDAFPGANWTGDLLQTGQQICVGRPSYECKDAPAALLPNGDVLFLAGVEQYKEDGYFNSRSRVLKWDGSSTKATLVEPNEGKIGNFWAEYISIMFPLPDGSIFIGGSPCRIYDPTTDEKTPLSSWRPVITSAPSQARAGRKFTLNGLQLNGLHEGGFFGDDKQTRTNFPIVKLTNTTTGLVYYARTKDFSYRGIQPSRPSSATVCVPSYVPAGTYNLVTTASGIESNPQTIQILPSIEGEPMFINAYM